MNTAESFAKNLLLEGKGISILKWSDKPDLIRALLVLMAVYKTKTKIIHMFLSSEEEAYNEFKNLFQLKPFPEDHAPDENFIEAKRDSLLIVFLQQAVSKTIGPILNGWRSALAAPPGTVIVVRSADMNDLQGAAPDMTSFVGPKMADTSSFLSVWTLETQNSITNRLPKEMYGSLRELPGIFPKYNEIETWIAQHHTDS